MRKTIAECMKLTYKVNNVPIVYSIFEFLDVYNNGGMEMSMTNSDNFNLDINRRSTDNLMSSLVHESGKHNAHKIFSGLTVNKCL